jgi:hypothetical protein
MHSRTWYRITHDTMLTKRTKHSINITMQGPWITETTISTARQRWT